MAIRQCRAISGVWLVGGWEWAGESVGEHVMCVRSLGGYMLSLYDVPKRSALQRDLGSGGCVPQRTLALGRLVSEAADCNADAVACRLIM